MTHLSENNWHFLNNLIYEIYDINDQKEMRMRFLKMIGLLIPYDKSTFYLASNEIEHYLCNPVGIGFSEKTLYSYFDEFEEIDFMKWIYPMAINKAMRQTDLFKTEERHQDPYFIKAYQPMNIEYAAILSLSYNKKFMGVVSLYRSKEENDFSDLEMQILDLVKNHLALRLFKDSEISASRKDYSSFWNNCIQNSIRKNHLTTKEAEVLISLLQGESNETICNSLFISLGTLKKHTSNIYKKLGITNRLGLFRIFSSIIQDPLK